MALPPQWLQYLEGRTVNFGAAVITGCAPYSRNVALRPLLDQLVRSATTLGAVYSRGRQAGNQQLLETAIVNAEKEALATSYWLRVLSEVKHEDALNKLQREADALTVLFRKMVLSLHSDK